MMRRGFPAELLKSNIGAVSKSRQPRRRGPSPLAESWIKDSVRTYQGRLNTALRELNWTQKELAERSGVSESVISRSAAGMNLWVAIALARAMGLRVGWLVASELPQWEREPVKAPPPAPVVVDMTEEVADRKQESETSRPSNVPPRARRPRH
jgi:transcriptional regulator with XRE-family HTH domain